MMDKNGVSFSLKRRKSLGLLVLMITIITASALLMVGVARAGRTESITRLESPVVASAALNACPATMISYWRFDETTGSVFTDSIKGLNASCSDNKCPGFALGKVNGAIDFDGIGDRVTAPNDADYDWVNGDSFSVELWVKTPNCNDSVFFGKHSFGASWWLGCGENGSLPVFSLRDSQLTSGIQITGSNSIGDDNWHHLVGMHDGVAKENRLYVDGVLEASTPVNYGGDYYNSNQLTFGHHFNSYFANATIDEVAAYNSILSASEIEEHYQSGLNGDAYCNGPPTAAGGSYATDVDVALPVTLSYSDPDGPGPYAFLIVNPPDHGSLSGSGANRTYTPAAGYAGSDSFTWRVNDGVDDSNVATVSILITAGGVNQAPIAESQNVSTGSGTPVVIELPYVDPDGGPGPYTFYIVDGPDHGSLSGSGMMRTYTPNAGYVGSDAFTWRVNDGIDDSNVATVTVEVGNLPPVAESNSYQTAMNTAVDVDLQYTDPDGGPGPYTITILDGPDHGSLSGSGTDRTYTPDVGHAGTDTFTWKVNDGSDDSNVATITVETADNTPANQPPVATSAAYTTDQGIPVLIELEFTDPDGGPGPNVVSITEQPQHGTLSGTGINREYTPGANFTGQDSFQWLVNDGLDDSNIATISINVFSEGNYIYLPVIRRAD